MSERQKMDCTNIKKIKKRYFKSWKFGILLLRDVNRLKGLLVKQ